MGDNKTKTLEEYAKEFEAIIERMSFEELVQLTVYMSVNTTEGHMGTLAEAQRIFDRRIT